VAIRAALPLEATGMAHTYIPNFSTIGQCEAELFII